MSITYHMVHMHAGPHPVVQDTHTTFRAAHIELCRDRDAFRRKAGNNNLLSTARYPSVIMWSPDGGETLRALPDAYDYGYDDYASEADTAAEADAIVRESYISAIERGMTAIAAHAE